MPVILCFVVLIHRRFHSSKASRVNTRRKADAIAFTCLRDRFQTRFGYINENTHWDFGDIARNDRLLVWYPRKRRIFDVIVTKGIANDTPVWLINDNGAGVYCIGNRVAP